MIEHITVSFQINQVVFVAFLAGLSIGLLTGTVAAALCAVEGNRPADQELPDLNQKKRDD
jgi:hypothetical protein